MYLGRYKRRERTSGQKIRRLTFDRIRSKGHSPVNHCSVCRLEYLNTFQCHNSKCSYGGKHYLDSAYCQQQPLTQRHNGRTNSDQKQPHTLDATRGLAQLLNQITTEFGNSVLCQFQILSETPLYKKKKTSGAIFNFMMCFSIEVPPGGIWKAKMTNSGPKSSYPIALAPLPPPGLHAVMYQNVHFVEAKCTFSKVLEPHFC